jgi:uncharacterized protein YjbI with pentapeptide repeats
MAKLNLKARAGRVWAASIPVLAKRGAWIVAAELVLALAVWLGWLLGTGRLDTGFGAYIPPATGAERAKTLWDWLDLLIVPLVLAGGALLFTWVTNRRERATETDRSREAALQGYLDRMAELIKDGLQESEPDDAKRSLARAWTLTALRQLDGRRNRLLLDFLRDSRLIGNQMSLDLTRADLITADLRGVNLRGLDLSGVVLNRADLSSAKLKAANLSDAVAYHGILCRADLSEANLTSAGLWSANLRQGDLTSANLSRADLHEANLRYANFRESDLREANLRDADLRGSNLTLADLKGANLLGALTTDEQLAQAKSLADATMPDGTKHE